MYPTMHFGPKTAHAQFANVTGLASSARLFRSPSMRSIQLVLYDLLQSSLSATGGNWAKFQKVINPPSFI